MYLKLHNIIHDPFKTHVNDHVSICSVFPQNVKLFIKAFVTRHNRGADMENEIHKQIHTFTHL